MGDKHLDTKDAYLAMYAFLERIYDATRSEELGGILGSMSFLQDGTTADPAVWSDWLSAIERVRRGSVDAALRLKS